MADLSSVSAVPSPPAEVSARRGFPLGALVLLFAAALLLRLHGLDRSLWIDEAGTIALAEAPHFPTAHSDVHPPLYTAILRLGLAWTDSVPLLRSFSVACGMALVALGCAFGASSRFEMAGHALAFALLPGLIYHSQELRPYALLYALFASALLLVVRGVETVPSLRHQVLLAFLLLAAAGTHQLTAFFLLSLLPLLLWPARHAGIRRLLQTGWPLLPAAVAVVWLNRVFLLRPDQMSGGWWVPAATKSYAWEILLEAAGWADAHRFLAAVTRNLPGGHFFETFLPSLGAIAVTSAVGVSCFSWKRDPLALLLASSAALYGTGLFLYSRVAESLLLPRTVLPLMIPLSLALVRGLHRQPHPWLRRGSALVLVLFLLAGAAWYASQARRPREDLRGLTAAIRTAHRPADLLVLLPNFDFALRPYWKSIDAENPLRLDQPASPAALAALRTRLDQLPPSARAHLVYRESFYFSPAGELSPALSALRQRGFTVTETWRRDGYVVLEATKP